MIETTRNPGKKLSSQEVHQWVVIHRTKDQAAKVMAVLQDKVAHQPDHRALLKKAALKVSFEK